MRPYRSPTQTFFSTLASISVAIVSFSILALTVTAWWPYEPVTKLDLAITNTPRPGGTLVVQIDYCKPNEASPVDVRWTLINDITILLDDGTATLPSGCHVTSRIFPVSPLVPAGRYRLQVEGLYEPWPWRRVQYLRRSPTFTIEP